MIRARVGEIDLPDLIRLLETTRRSAVITLSNNRLYGRIHLADGRLVYARAEPGTHLGEYLVRHGFLNFNELQDLIRSQSQENPGTRLGRLAIEKGMLSNEEMREVLVMQIVDALATILSAREGEFAAEATPENASQTSALETLDTSSMMLEAMRRLDEWRRGQVEPNAVLTIKGNPATYGLSGDQWGLVELIDGRKRARSIALESEFPEEQVYHLLYEMQQSGLLGPAQIPPVDPAVLVLAESAVLQRLLFVSLERARYRVIPCYSLEEAQDALAKERPAGVMLQTPDLPQATRALRSLPAGRYIPFWAVSQDPPRGFWVRTNRLQHLQVPFTEAKVLAAVSVIRRPV